MKSKRPFSHSELRLCYQVANIFVELKLFIPLNLLVSGVCKAIRTVKYVEF